MSDSVVISGVFKEEVKNRFLCLVEVNGVDTLCYIPSSCRLSNFINLKEKEVLLVPLTSKNTRTKYSVYALKNKKKYILLNMSYANKIIEKDIMSRRFAFLGKRKHLFRERVIDEYKCDLYIEDTRTIVEVKSILSFEKIAIFPSVYSQRAVDQLHKLNKLIIDGYRVCYIFVSLNSSVNRIDINSSIDDYYKAYLECSNNGMITYACSLYYVAGQFEIHNSIDIGM